MFTSGGWKGQGGERSVVILWQHFKSMSRNNSMVTRRFPSSLMATVLRLPFCWYCLGMRAKNCQIHLPVHSSCQPSLMPTKVCRRVSHKKWVLPQELHPFLPQQHQGTTAISMLIQNTFCLFSVSILLVSRPAHRPSPSFWLNCAWCGSWPCWWNRAGTILIAFTTCGKFSLGTKRFLRLLCFFARSYLCNASLDYPQTFDSGGSHCKEELGNIYSVQVRNFDSWPSEGSLLPEKLSFEMDTYGTFCLTWLICFVVRQHHALRFLTLSCSCSCLFFLNLQLVFNNVQIAFRTHFLLHIKRLAITPGGPQHGYASYSDVFTSDVHGTVTWPWLANIICVCFCFIILVLVLFWSLSLAYLVFVSDPWLSPSCKLCPFWMF